MAPKLNVIVSLDRQTQTQLDRIERKLDQILRLETQEMSDLTNLTSKVSANTDVIQSAVEAFAGLAEEIRTAGTDQAALDALATQIETNSQALADAIVKSTPAEPPVEPTP